MDKELEKLLDQVEKRERQEWERCQIMHEKFGSDDKLSEISLARWSQWNDFKYILLTIKEK
tara:strand:+ start:5502 stop:5684 length:183 start_codon:yes stop_codon:yes gene_type:complete